MTIRACIVAALCVATLSATALAQSTPATSKNAAAPDSTIQKKRPPAKPAPKAPAGSKGGIRTIDAINIEGEIAVPQVLFITSRDNRRYRDGLGKNFRKGTIDVARSLEAPNRLCVAGSK